MNGLREHEHRSKIKPTDDEQVDCSANESRDKETYDRTSDSLQLLMHQGNTPVQETNSHQDLSREHDKEQVYCETQI